MRLNSLDEVELVITIAITAAAGKQISPLSLSFCWRCAVVVPTAANAPLS
jgi:hypothetical protein